MTISMLPAAHLLASHMLSHSTHTILVPLNTHSPSPRSNRPSDHKRQVCSPCIAITGEPAHPITREGLLLLTVLAQLTRLAAEGRVTEWRADSGRSQTVEITNQVCSLQQQMKHPLAVRFAGS
jgi:hypothetical protein